MSSRETSNAFRRSRSAASSAFSQPCSMWMRLHRPCSPPSPCFASQGCSLPSVLTFSCSALSASMRADRSACRALCVFTSCCLARRSSSSCGTCSCSSCSRASAVSAASCAAVSCCCRLTRRCSSGAASALRSATSFSRRWFCCRDCSSMLRWSAASTWICCWTCPTAVRCSVARDCAWRKASSRSGSCWSCSSTCAASSAAFSSPSTARAARFSISAAASSLRSTHWAACSFNCTRRCSARWRPSTTKRISASSRPTSALAS